MKSPIQHQFSQVPTATIPRSTFDRSFGHKTTFDAGYLIPVYLDEALPGDTFNLRMSAFARLATPLKPIMDNMYLDSFFFAIPIRLIWNNFEKFMGAQDNPGDSTSYVVPQIVAPNVASGGVASGSLSDYMGIPIEPLNGGGGTTGIAFNSLWHRAYNLCWNTWFRDQNLQNSVTVDKGDGPDTYSNYVLLRRGKRHDYFTSALPWPQKGADVTLPLGTSAPVVTNNNAILIRGVTNNVDKNLTLAAANVMNYSGGVIVENAKFGSQTGLQADLSTATAATINALRNAFQLQKLLERDARGGTRYTEIIKAHFGVTSPDSRLQRPEYLGGGSARINIHPVEKTSSALATIGDTTPQGNLAAFGTVAFNGHGFTKSFTEHCVILGLVSVRADQTYQYGLNTMFSRRTKYNFYWPALAHIGEQQVINKEIYANLPDGTGANQKDGVYGYQERYAEYRYKPSMVTGLFRSNAVAGGASGTLDFWHLAQAYTSQPVLNAAFIQEDPPIDRCIAVPVEPHFIFDSYFDLKCARPMPVYGVPGLIDHF